MNIELEKKLIIEEVKMVHDEWLLKALKKLLGIDVEDDIPQDHKDILDRRVQAYESGTIELVDWEDAKKRLARKK